MEHTLVLEGGTHTLVRRLLSLRGDGTLAVRMAEKEEQVGRDRKN